MIKDCPHLIKSSKGDKGKGNKFKTKRHRSMSKWKLIAPKDPNETKFMNGKLYHWCTKCGDWTPTHKTETHVGGKPTEPTSGQEARAESNHVVTDAGVWMLVIDLPDEDKGLLSAETTLTVLKTYFLRTSMLFVLKIMNDYSLTFNLIQVKNLITW